VRALPVRGIIGLERVGGAATVRAPDAPGAAFASHAVKKYSADLMQNNFVTPIGTNTVFCVLTLPY
jgi:hypothetical protein